MSSRKDIVARARWYVAKKTPFIHQQRQNHGVDCVGLVLCVAQDLKLMDITGHPFLRSDYPIYQGFNAQQEGYKRFNRKLRTELLPGDVVIMRCPIEACHFGIISERKGVLYLINAINTGKFTAVEHILDFKWMRRITDALSFPGVE